MHKIAIIGAGFAGLSAAWHFLQKPLHSVTLFDPSGVGGGASGIATGLLHPYVGEQGRRSERATEGLEAAKKLIRVAEEELGEQIILSKGILRYMQNAEQMQMFLSHMEKYQDVRRVGENRFLIESGMTIDCSKYLEGLGRAVAKSGGEFIQNAVTDLSALFGYDQIIVAAGAGIRHFPELSSLRLSVLKGQVLVCRGEVETSAIGKGYVALGKEGTCYVGSTYERDVVDAVPDLEKAKEIILPKIRSFFPEVDKFEVVGCKAALRVVRPGHYFPIAERVKDNIWVFTALGSRGLLYHGLLGEQLVSNNISFALK